MIITKDSNPNGINCVLNHYYEIEDQIKNSMRHIHTVTMSLMVNYPSIIQNEFSFLKIFYINQFTNEVYNNLDELFKFPCFHILKTEHQRVDDDDSLKNIIIYGPAVNEQGIIVQCEYKFPIKYILDPYSCYKDLLKVGHSTLSAEQIKQSEIDFGGLVESDEALIKMVKESMTLIKNQCKSYLVKYPDIIAEHFPFMCVFYSDGKRNIFGDIDNMFNNPNFKIFSCSNPAGDSDKTEKSEKLIIFTSSCLTGEVLRYEFPIRYIIKPLNCHLDMYNSSHFDREVVMDDAIEEEFAEGSQDGLSTINDCDIEEEHSIDPADKFLDNDGLKWTSDEIDRRMIKKMIELLTTKEVDKAICDDFDKEFVDRLKVLISQKDTKEEIKVLEDFKKQKEIVEQFKKELDELKEHVSKLSDNNGGYNIPGPGFIPTPSYPMPGPGWGQPPYPYSTPGPAWGWDHHVMFAQPSPATCSCHTKQQNP